MTYADGVIKAILALLAFRVAMNANEFIHNVSAHTLEELAPYKEQYVAWTEDGKEILAYAPNEAQLYREIDRLGLTRYVVDFIPDADISFLGGGAF
jgi:hypothetical protein